MVEAYYKKLVSLIWEQDKLVPNVKTLETDNGMLAENTTNWACCGA